MELCKCTFTLINYDTFVQNLTHLVEHKGTPTGIYIITLECYKPLDIPWRCRTKSSTSPRDARSVFLLLRTSGSLWPVVSRQIYAIFHSVKFAVFQGSYRPRSLLVLFTGRFKGNGGRCRQRNLGSD